VLQEVTVKLHYFGCIEYISPRIKWTPKHYSQQTSNRNATIVAVKHRWYVYLNLIKRMPHGVRALNVHMLTQSTLWKTKLSL